MTWSASLSSRVWLRYDMPVYQYWRHRLAPATLAQQAEMRTLMLHAPNSPTTHAMTEYVAQYHVFRKPAPSKRNTAVRTNAPLK